MMAPIKKPPSAPGVIHTNAFSGANSSAEASALTRIALAIMAATSSARGDGLRSRHSSVSDAPTMPQAVMMVSDSQYCSTVSTTSGRI